MSKPLSPLKQNPKGVIVRAVRKKYVAPDRHSKTPTPSRTKNSQTEPVLAYEIDSERSRKGNQAKNKYHQRHQRSTRLLVGLDCDHDRQDDQEQHQQQQPHELDILPPHLPLEAPAAHAELSGAPAEAVRLVDEQVDPLAALEQALDVPGHDAAHVVDLALGAGDGVVAAAARGAVVDHEALELGVEGAGAVVGHVGEVGLGGGELGEEALADLEQEAEGHAPAEGGLGDHQEGEPARGGGAIVLGGRLGDVVDVVVPVGVGELLGRVVLDLGQDQRGEGGGL